MSTKTTSRRPGESEIPDLEAEREVDLRRHWNAIAMRWWLLAAGVAVGIVIGFLTTLGGSQVYKARAVVYLGQPLSQSGVQVQSQATNPSTVHQIVQAPATIDAVARQVGLKPGQLSGHVSTQAVTGAITKLGQNPLVAITVTGHLRAKVAAAANALASTVVNAPALARYSKIKIRNLRSLVVNEKAALASIDASAKTLQASLRGGSGLSTAERLILLGQLNGLLQQRLSIVDQLSTNQQQLALAQDVESPQVTIGAVAQKTTARSRRNAVIVGALIGLIIGIVAALLWEPVLRVVRHTP